MRSAASGITGSINAAVTRKASAAWNSVASSFGRSSGFFAIVQGSRWTIY